jgi:hypothetical protein
MNRRYFIAAILCFCAFWACWCAYVRNGSYVDQDGVLHEQFGFIPLGWLFVFAGLVLFGLSWLRRK